MTDDLSKLGLTPKSVKDIKKDMNTLKDLLGEAYKKDSTITVGMAIDDIQEGFDDSLDGLSEKEAQQRNYVREAAIEELYLYDGNIRSETLENYLNHLFPHWKMNLKKLR